MAASTRSLGIAPVSRSTTASMVWRVFLSTFSSSARSSTSPLSRTRTSPRFRSEAKRSRNSPLRFRISGAITR